MADINREAQEFAAIMEDVNREMKLYGQLHASTAERLKDAEMKAKFGIDNFSKATGMGADALIKLGSAAFTSGKTLLEGKKGAAALNGSLDELSEAVKIAAVGLSLLIPGGPLIKGLVAGITFLAVSAMDAGKKYTQAANEMSDKLYKGYQDLAQSGAAASDGMTGLFNDAKKLGLSMNEIGQYTELIAANSKDLALFSGTVFEGRQKFADMGKSMEQYREGLMNAGMTQEQINSGMMGYLKLQSRVGQSQNKTTAELADGAKKYLIEMDGLSKITGETRKGMEDQMEAARSEERFAAKLQELRSQGRFDEAKELEKTNLILASQSKEAAQGFRDLSTGMITTEAAQKTNLLTQGEAMKQADRLSNGLAKAGDAATAIGTAAGKTANALTPLAKAGAAGDVIGDYSGALRLGVAAQNNFGKQLTESEKELERQGGKGGKAADAAVQAQTDLVRMQQKGNEAVERFVFAGVVPATNAMTKLVEATTLGASAMSKMFGVGVGPQAAAGAAAGPSTAQSRLTEAAAGEKAAADAERARAAEKDARLSKEEKETIKKQAAESERAYMDEGRKLREAHLREKNARRAERRAGTAAPAGGGAIPAGGGGGAAAAPSTRSMAPTTGPSGQEGGPAPIPKASEVIKFGTGSGSAENFAGLNTKVSDAVVKAAEEYQAATGNKIQLNSAKRDSEKQKELYDAWIAGGKRGMPVAPPGTSLHEKGLAVDIQNYNDPAAVAAMNRQGLTQKVAGDPVHFSFDGGGVLKGPEQGYQPNLTMHGTEAVIPMKNGAVPVSLDLKQALSGPTFGGASEYGGLNQGPMSTDIEAVKNIAAAAGAFDKASQTITDPNTWKQILSSGLATNYQMGTATIGTAGIEGLGEDIANRLKEIKEQSNTDTDAALKQVADEFKTAMAQLVQQLSVSANPQNVDSTTAGLLQELISATKNGVDVQQKILASNY